MENDIKKVMEIIKNSNNIVFFGGAGVSTASNIPDFRGANGLYNFTPEEIISHTFFKKHTDEFFEFYWSKMVYDEAKPNACHIFLSELEKEGKLKAVITQNIDGLHQKAGSKNVIELHGSVLDNYCERCGRYFPLSKLVHNGVPHCPYCEGVIKPDVVLYEEPLKEENIINAINYISNCDTLIVGGTSLVVYPAAGLIRYFKGKNLILINKGETYINSQANIVINDDITKVLNVKNYKI